MATLYGISGRIRLSFSARRATQRPRAQPKRPSSGAVALATFGKRLGTSPTLHMVPCAARWAAALLARPTVPIDRPLTGATSARARARQTLLPNLDDPARCEQRCRSMDALSPKGVAHTGQRPCSCEKTWPCTCTESKQRVSPTHSPVLRRCALRVQREGGVSTALGAQVSERLLGLLRLAQLVGGLGLRLERCDEPAPVRGRRRNRLRKG